MKSDEPLFSLNHRQATTPAATELFKQTLLSSSNLVINESSLNTSNEIVSNLTQQSKTTGNEGMSSKENSFLVNSNHRNIINHFFSQVKVKGGHHHHNNHHNQHKPIIKTNDSNANPIILPSNATTSTNPTSNIFITSCNSTTQITIHELQLSRNNTNNNPPQSKSTTQQQATNHVHFTSPLPVNSAIAAQSASNGNGNNFTINTINLLPLNTNNFSSNTPPLTNNINVNNINGFHSASVNKLSTTSQNNLNYVKNGLQPLNNKNLNFIRSSSFRHKNTNPNTTTNGNSKLGKQF